MQHKQKGNVKDLQEKKSKDILIKFQEKSKPIFQIYAHETVFVIICKLWQILSK